jgi:hypothetical protein
MADNLQLAKALRQAEMRPTPRSGMTGMLADALMGARNFADRAKVPDFVPLIGGEGVGSLLVGKAPEEVNELSYGNSPIQMNPYAGRTASFVPEMKRGRGQQLADALSLLSLPGGKTAASMMMGAVPGVDAAATVFHGSPHKFDRFDSSKIGTGEGAQAYGHGLYLADSPDVARTYSADRAYVGASMQGKPQAINYDDPAWIAQTTIDELGDPSKAVARLQMVARTAAKNMSPESAAGVQGAIDLILSGSVGPKGQLYKVDLPDEAIAKMLDWDKPLSQQVPALEALSKNKDFAQYVERIMERPLSKLDGKTLQRMAIGYAADKGLGGASGAADVLRQAGIPGIRYLDAGSRGQGQGSSNYVVFPGNENLLTILERNGQLLGTK